MKQRITYLVHNPEEFTPGQLEVTSSSLKLDKLNAAKEHRITIGLSELPRELGKAIEQWHELHIRWATTRPYTAVPPFLSRVSPGLHVFFTPLKGQPAAPLCPLIQDVFGKDLKCSDEPEQSSIKMPILSERFSMSASDQYYSFLPSLEGLISFVNEQICKGDAKCQERVSSLKDVDYLDIDFDTISHAVVLNAYWGKASGGSWAETISLPGKEETIEIGVLNHEPNPDPEDIGFSGFLVVLGQDQALKPTRFQTPTRHYPLSPKSPAFKTSFSHPTGLHPTLTLSFPPSSSLTPPDRSCKLHAHLTLPSYLFIDKYQFSDPLFLASHHLTSLRSIAGATDLEAPDWVVPQWGSAALFEIAIPDVDFDEDDELAAAVAGEWNVSIPLHLRYLPAAPAPHSRVPVPWPAVFWACRAEEGTKMNVNPFDRIHLGYEGLFGPRTRFMHVPPSTAGNGSGALVQWIDVPVLDLRGARWVEVGTVGAVLVAFLGLCWALFGKRGGGGAKAEVEKKKQ